MKIKKFLVSIFLFASVFVTGVALTPPEVVIAASLSGADKLIGLGMPDGLARYFASTLISVNSSGNIIIPIASGKNAQFTIAGSQTVTVNSSGITVPGILFPTGNYESVASAGTTVADATAFSGTKHIHRLTGADGTAGWKFTTSIANQFEILLNTTAGVPKIYAASGGTCNGGATDAACTLVTGIVAHLCYSTAVNTWVCS